MDRFEFWRDLVTRKVLRMAIDRLTDAPFEADAVLRSQHGLTIGVGQIGPSVNHRTREIVAADNDDLILMANLSGPFIMSCGDNEIELRPGDAALASCAEVSRYVRAAPGKLLCARLPRRMLAALTPDPEARTGRVIPRETSALRMLIAYSNPLWDDDQLAVEPDVSKFVVDHLCDLVALSTGARGDAAEFAAARGGRAAKLQSIKSLIEDWVGPNEFSIEDVAGEVGVSPRYIRKLLEAEGYSFSRYVAERRLARAHKMLTSPRHARLSIAAIAYDVGFGDLSYFNRVFRRQYDQTPSDIRAAGR